MNKGLSFEGTSKFNFVFVWVITAHRDSPVSQSCLLNESLIFSSIHFILTKWRSPNQLHSFIFIVPYVGGGWNSSCVPSTLSIADIKGRLNKQENRQRMWVLLSWSQTREAVNHNPWAQTEFTTPIKTPLGSEARGSTILLVYLWAPSFFIQSFSFREQKQINESQIRTDNSRYLSKKEIIKFEVMKVLPEVKELH